MSEDNDICGAICEDGTPCQRPPGWGTPYSDGRCKNHLSDEPEKTEPMDLPFFDSDDPPDSDDLEQKLAEKREELASVRKKHEQAREVVEERSQTLRELRARKEVGADVEDAIDEVEEELETAREKRSDLGERLGALEEAIPILEDRLQEARQEEVQAEYDELTEEIKGKVEKTTELLAEAAELQAEARLLAHKGHALSARHGANDYFGCGGAQGANHMWCLFTAADAAPDWISGEEPFSIVRNPRGLSRVMGYLDDLQADDRLEDISITRPDPVTEGTTESRFDE